MHTKSLALKLTLQSTVVKKDTFWHYGYMETPAFNPISWPLKLVTATLANHLSEMISTFITRRKY